MPNMNQQDGEEAVDELYGNPGPFGIFMTTTHTKYPGSYVVVRLINECQQGICARLSKSVIWQEHFGPTNNQAATAINEARLEVDFLLATNTTFNQIYDTSSGITRPAIAFKRQSRTGNRFGVIAFAGQYNGRSATRADLIAMVALAGLGFEKLDSTDFSDFRRQHCTSDGDC